MNHSGQLNSGHYTAFDFNTREYKIREQWLGFDGAAANRRYETDDVLHPLLLKTLAMNLLNFTSEFASRCR